MPLPALRGHAEARAALGRAARGGLLPQSILLHGAPGLGKERFGLWLAQLLLCAQPEAGQGAAPEPCGRCQPCRLVERLQHPDVHWFFPLPRPDASSPEKLREKLEELRAAELEKRRADPLYLPAFDRAPAHFLAAVQTLLQLAAARPSLGEHKVFIIGDAELMVPQESSPEAANAFLKLLEEPPSGTTLILTAQRAGALLPTIVSRVLPVRLRPLSVTDVAGYLVAAGAADAAEAERIARRADGAIGQALRLLPRDGGTAPLEQQRAEARDLLAAVLSTSPVSRLAAAHRTPPSGARGEFVGLLDAFAAWLRDLMALAAGATSQIAEPDAAEFCRRALRAGPIQPTAVAAALERVTAARELAERNVNPQLIVAEMLRGVQHDLRGAA